MIDPVVAADGHTYERSAIARWLSTSNRSPMTGSILPHKNLVTNYGLLSSIEEAARASTRSSSIANNNKLLSDVVPIRVIDVDESASVAMSLTPSMETMETIAVTPTASNYAQAPLPSTDMDDDDYDYSSSL